MPTLPILSMKNETVGDIALSDNVFGGKVNEHLLWEASRQYLASERSGTAKTKTRGEVSGAGRKLWRQKGTGRARVGSIRTPLWRHGGTVHGPQPRDYSYRMPRKAHHGAMRSALAQKAQDGAIRVLSDLELSAPRTAEAARLLKTLELKEGAVIVTLEKSPALELAVRNIPRVSAKSATTLTVFDVLKHRCLVMTREAAEKLEEVYAR